MKQLNAANGAKITFLSADKYKRLRISINFILKNNRQSATDYALLPYLMGRSSAAFPDMTLLSKQLSKLYGAQLNVSSSSSGANRILTVSVTGIKNEFALKGESLALEYLSLALSTAFNPHFVDGEFEQSAVNIEREKLREELEGEINEKRSYCIRQARRKFFKDTPEGVESSGYLDEVDDLTPSSVTLAYKNMLKTSKIEILVFGIEEALVQAQLTEYLAKIERSPLDIYPNSAQASRSSECFKQAIDSEQGKLCLMFTSGDTIPVKDFYKLRTAISLLGSTPTSRLFVNVREKQSLCYYCAASFSSLTGVLCIDSGIEHTNAEKTRDAILKELEIMKIEQVTDKELADTKRSLINSIGNMTDTLSGLESWYLSEIIYGSTRSPNEVKEEINSVTKDDIQKFINMFSLSVEYVLTQKGSLND